MKTILREVCEQDLDAIRLWRNQPNIRRNMFAQHIISPAEHQQWFTANQQDPLRFLLLYEEDDDARGFVQLQKKSQENGVFEWGFYINPDANLGSGSRMTRLALHQAFSELGALKMYAEVLDFNHASIRLHQKLGFVLEGKLRQQHEIEQQYHDVYCFGLLKSEWMS